MHSGTWKLFCPLSAAATILILAIWALPIQAGIVSGSDIGLTPNGSGGPDIEVTTDDKIVALAYYKIAGETGGVYIKSGAADPEGWRTRLGLLGVTNQPPRLVIQPGSYTATVVWRDSTEGDSKDKAIKYAQCILSETAAPDCVTIGTVYSNPVKSLSSPDVAVNANGHLYVAWANIDGDIGVAVYDGNSWTAAPDQFSFVENTYSLPVLAWSSGRVHLAFLDDVDNPADGDADGIRYYYSADDGLSWTNSAGANSYINGKGTPPNEPNEISSGYDALDRPTIAAIDNKVYLAWDVHRANSLYFDLMRQISANNGENWDDPKHITLDTPVDLTEGDKYSQISESPVLENGLQPSLTISGPTYAIVWQQRPDESCGGGEGGSNSSSEIYAAYTSTTWITDTLVDVANGEDTNYYSIDPDLAVDSSGVRHFVFMKADPNTDCASGGVAQDPYAIYYRGPFTTLTNDQGEGGVFLPTILKNS